jgi:hypothetical protein
MCAVLRVAIVGVMGRISEDEAWEALNALPMQL